MRKFSYFVLFLLTPACVESCDEVLQHDTITGTDAQDVWLTLKPGRCAQLSVDEVKRPVILKLSEGLVTHGLVFHDVIPTTFTKFATNADRCPANDLACEGSGAKVCKKEFVGRGWGNGCSLFGEGPVCTCVTIRDAGIDGNQYVWVYRLTRPVVHATITFLDQHGPTQNQLPGTYWVSGKMYHGICTRNSSGHYVMHAETATGRPWTQCTVHQGTALVLQQRCLTVVIRQIFRGQISRRVARS